MDKMYTGKAQRAETKFAQGFYSQCFLLGIFGAGIVKIILANI